jgi:hypothetical protein
MTRWTCSCHGLRWVGTASGAAGYDARSTRGAVAVYGDLILALREHPSRRVMLRRLFRRLGR